MINRSKLMEGLNLEEDKFIAAHALDKVESVLKGADMACTNFLDPHQQDIVEPLVSKIPGIKYRFMGGYERAERRRLVIIPEYMMWEMIQVPLAYLIISGNFEFQQVSHRDYLGSILGLGLKRDMIGDILINPDGGCQVIVALEVKDIILTDLKRVHQISVKVLEIKEEELNVPEERVKEINTTVASLRLDAVASAGFSCSRTKMAKDIKTEKVKINYQTISDPSRAVNQGDIISIRGKGRVEISRIEGETRKGRVKLTLKRFI